MSHRSMPDNWEPPFPAWCAHLGDIKSIVIAYIGLQIHTDDVGEPEAALRLIKRGADSPDNVERGQFDDLTGLVNHVFVCYWRDPQVYVRFAEESAFSEWLADDSLLNSGVGVWIEAFRIPLARFETLFSSEIPVGAARLSDKPMTGPVIEHGYWGGMRDRIPASDSDGLFTPLDDVPKIIDHTETKGRRLLLTPPENLCLIRSGQDWSSCRGEERDSYLRDVHPLLKRGMQFLMENPDETGCLTCRFIHQLGDSGHAEDKTFGMAYFFDMRRLEIWAKSHPTHIAIFNSFMSLAQRLGGTIRLRLWHEVAVLPTDGARLEYVNCHARTGLLPFLALTSGSE